VRHANGNPSGLLSVLRPGGTLVPAVGLAYLDLSSPSFLLVQLVSQLSLTLHSRTRTPVPLGLDRLLSA
jgi:hypothetical protein